MPKECLHGTTILSIRTVNKVVIGGDGQVSLGNTVLKSNSCKIRRIKTMHSNEPVLTGFAGATADAFTLLERLETKLEKHPRQLKRACVELAKDWRTDKYLRKLEAMMIVADADITLLLTGSGDVISPDCNIAAIGSGGSYALAAAKGMILNKRSIKNPENIVRQSLCIAADICVFTNRNISVETIDIK